MSERVYAYGDEISPTHLAEALPTSADGSVDLWRLPWDEIENLTSTVYGIALADDVWDFPERLFRNGTVKRKIRPSRRIVDFSSLRRVPTRLDLTGIMRRAKRMAWLYLHASHGALRSASTVATVLQRFLLMLRSLIQAQAFTHMPDDECPDGPMFFRELTKVIFDRHVPVEATMRSGINLLEALPNHIDDRLRFSVQTYQTAYSERAASRNIAKGKHPGAVQLTSVDDLNLSRLLSVCDVYRKYPDLLDEIWEWLGHTGCLPQRSNGDSAPCDASGNRVPERQIGRRFQEEVLEPNWRRWLAAGYICDDEGTLAAPVYSSANRQYRNAADLVTRRSLKTCVNAIQWSNSVFLGFLTGARSQEIGTLPFDALAPVEDQTLPYDRIIGPEMKSNDQIDGFTRDWPLPKAAVGLITSTQKLHKIRSQVLGAEIPSTLFGRETNAPALCTQMLADEKGYTGPADNLLRRMRPSSAQMVADVARIPLAVRTVLGHATMEETFGYCRGKPDDEYRDLIEQTKRARDRAMGTEMLSVVKSEGATDRMTRGVIKMAIDQIVALNLGDEITVERARDLQAQVDKVKPTHFSKVYEMIGEDRWQVDEFIGESISQPRPFQFCTAKKGGAHFSGACSTSDNITNPKNCRSHCPYNFEANAGLQMRADWIEKELSRGHFYDSEITTEDPIFYNSAMKILDWLWGFEGPLQKFKSDPRLLGVVKKIAKDSELLQLFKGEARRTLRELSAL